MRTVKISSLEREYTLTSRQASDLWQETQGRRQLIRKLQSSLRINFGRGYTLRTFFNYLEGLESQGKFEDAQSLRNRITWQLDKEVEKTLLPLTQTQEKLVCCAALLPDVDPAELGALFSLSPQEVVEKLQTRFGKHPILQESSLGRRKKRWEMNRWVKPLVANYFLRRRDDLIGSILAEGIATMVSQHDIEIKLKGICALGKLHAIRCRTNSLTVDQAKIDFQPFIFVFQIAAYHLRPFELNVLSHMLLTDPTIAEVLSPETRQRIREFNPEQTNLLVLPESTRYEWQPVFVRRPIQAIQYCVTEQCPDLPYIVVGPRESGVTSFLTATQDTIFEGQQSSPWNRLQSPLFINLDNLPPELSAQQTQQQLIHLLLAQQRETWERTGKKPCVLIHDSMHPATVSFKHWFSDEWATLFPASLAAGRPFLLIGASSSTRALDEDDQLTYRIGLNQDPPFNNWTFPGHIARTSISVRPGVEVLEELTDIVLNPQTQQMITEYTQGYPQLIQVACAKVRRLRGRSRSHQLDLASLQVALSQNMKKFVENLLAPLTPDQQRTLLTYALLDQIRPDSYQVLGTVLPSETREEPFTLLDGEQQIVQKPVYTSITSTEEQASRLWQPEVAAVVGLTACPKPWIARYQYNPDTRRLLTRYMLDWQPERFQKVCTQIAQTIERQLDERMQEHPSLESLFCLQARSFVYQARLLAVLRIQPDQIIIRLQQAARQFLTQLEKYYSSGEIDGYIDRSAWVNDWQYPDILHEQGAPRI